MFGRNRFSEARELFRLAVAHRNDYYDAWFNLRDTCTELGLAAERDEAAEMTRRLGG